MESGSVQISWSPDVAGNRDEVLQVIEAAQESLESEDLIGHPLSLKSLVDVLPGDPAAEQRMSLVELLPTDLKRAFYVPEEHRAKINFRIRDLGIAAYSPVFKRIESQFAEIAAAHPGFQFSLAGKAAWRWRNLHQIVVDLALSLGTASIVIFLVLTIAYRSIRLGLIALIPNFFPLALTGTWLVVTGQSLEVSMVCAFTVCLGIAVDDTIHFLTRFREESAHQSEAEAIRSAFVSTGAALIMTTVILVIGFSTVIMSGMREQRIFATMACLTIASALAGDLLFLPAMLAYFRKSSSESEEQETIPFPVHGSPDHDEEEHRKAA
jgi:predicted RND superfamily exporter protein